MLSIAHRVTVSFELQLNSNSIQTTNNDWIRTLPHSIPYSGLSICRCGCHKCHLGLQGQNAECTMWFYTEFCLLYQNTSKSKISFIHKTTLSFANENCDLVVSISIETYAYKWKLNIMCFFQTLIGMHPTLCAEAQCSRQSILKTIPPLLQTTQTLPFLLATRRS